MVRLLGIAAFRALRARGLGAFAGPVSARTHQGDFELAL